jgi:hypothetical protein
MNRNVCWTHEAVPYICSDLSDSPLSVAVRQFAFAEVPAAPPKINPQSPLTLLAIQHAKNESSIRTELDRENDNRVRAPQAYSESPPAPSPARAQIMSHMCVQDVDAMKA